MKFANELEMKKQLRQLYEQGCTESDLEDFAFDNDVDMGQVFRIVAEWSAPAACKGCSHISVTAICTLVTAVPIMQTLRTDMSRKRAANNEPEANQ